MSEYSALLTEARKSRFVLVRELVAALEAEIRAHNISHQLVVEGDAEVRVLEAECDALRADCERLERIVSRM